MPFIIPDAKKKTAITPTPSPAPTYVKPASPIARIPDVYEPETLAKQEQAEQLAQKATQAQIVESFEANAPPELDLTPTPIYGGRDTVQQELQKEVQAPVEAKGGELIVEERREGVVSLVDVGTRNAKREDFLTAGLAVGGLAAGVAAPVVAGIGAGVGLGVSQGAKVVLGGGLLSPEEAVQAAGAGAVFSVVGGGVMGGAAKAAPVIASKSLASAASRIALTTGLGAGFGGGLGGASAWAQKRDVLTGVKEGAVLGGAFGAVFGVTAEAVRFGAPYVKRGISAFQEKLSPEKAMLNRVVLEGELRNADQLLAEQAKPTDYSLDLSDKVLGKLGLKTAKQTAIEQMYQKVTTLKEAPKITFGKDVFGSGLIESKSGLIQQTIVKPVAAVKAPFLVRLRFPSVFAVPTVPVAKTAASTITPVKTRTLKAKQVPKVLTKLDLGIGDVSRSGPSSLPLTPKQIEQNAKLRLIPGGILETRADLIPQPQAAKKETKTITVPLRVPEPSIAKVRRRARNPFLEYQGRSYNPIRETQREEDLVISPFIPSPAIPKSIPQMVHVPKTVVLPKVMPTITPTQDVKITPAQIPKTTPIQIPKQINRTTPKQAVTQIQRTTQRQIPKGLNIPLAGGDAASRTFARFGGRWIPRKHRVKTPTEMFKTFGVAKVPKGFTRLSKMETPKGLFSGAKHKSKRRKR